MASKNSSPGVYMTEKDLTFSVETVGVTTLGLAGETKKGPAFQPFFVKSYDDFKTFFGGTSPEKFKGTQIPKYELPYIAKSYLTQSNQLYVTRVLGLSGYNAGGAWALKTIGTCDITTLDYVVTPTQFTVEVDGSDLFYVESGVTTTTTIAEKTAELVGENVDSTIFNTTFATFFTVPSGPFTTSKAAYWGTVPATEYTGYTGYNLYNLPSEYTVSQEQEHWLTNYFAYNSIIENYDGKAFFIYAETTANPAQYLITLGVLEYTCDANPEFHNKVIGVIRSAADYEGDTLTFSITAGSGLTISGTVETNPYASFSVNATTHLNDSYTYNVSLDSNEKNFITNVLGENNRERNSEVWVEEIYNKALVYGFNHGLVKGLNPALEYTAAYANYNFGYQTPATPFFVSELRGGVAIDLFRLVEISDGADANTEIKISIANVDLGKKTFDVYVRAFADDDKRPTILEKYFNCNMNPDTDNYIGRKIGTVDGQYDLISKYVMVDVADNAPIDAVPAGFNGYEFKSLNSLSASPVIPYKTKYYNPGDVMYTPTLANPVTSSGDKIKKIYLGFTDSEFGADADLLAFKGKTGSIPVAWPYLTNGFHMDMNADPTIYSVGAGTFTTESAIGPNHPYYDMNSRKFTALFAGGFDGWDIFRDSRTNLDDYKIGRTGFIDGGFDTFYSDEFGETFGKSDYYAYLYGIKTYINPETVSINIFATPGIDIINNTDLVRDAIDMVEENRQDSIYLPTLPDMNLFQTQSSDTTQFTYPNDMVASLEETNIDTNYAAVFYPWIQIFDTENNTNLFIPPTSEVIRNLALTDNVAYPWYATAGYSRGIVNAKRSRIKVDQEQRDTLYDGRINPISTDPSVGTVIWGNRNLQVADSALNRLNIKRLMLQAKKLIQAVSKRLLFEPNDERVRSEFLSLVNPILDNIRKERGLYDFRVKVSDDPADLDRNTLSGKIYLKPTRTLEYIELEFNVTPTSVSFDSIS